MMHSSSNKPYIQLDNICTQNTNTLCPTEVNSKPRSKRHNSLVPSTKLNLWELIDKGCGNHRNYSPIIKPNDEIPKKSTHTQSHIHYEKDSSKTNLSQLKKSILLARENKKTSSDNNGSKVSESVLKISSPVIVHSRKFAK